MMKKLSSLTIFFPAYDDAKTLPYLICRAYQAGKLASKRFEILIINDGSTDETRDVVRVMEKKFSEIKIISHNENLGYGAALRTGFGNAKGEFVFYTDGDGQYDPMELVSLANKLTPVIDVVNGYKQRRADPFIRRLLGAFYNRFAHVFYTLPIRDIDCDFRLIRKSLLKPKDLHAVSGKICLELILQLQESGARFCEIPVHHYPRMVNRSKFFTLKYLLSTFREYLGLGMI